MASITSLGIGSGLNIQDLVSKLVEAEKAPTQKRIEVQRSDIQAKLSAFGQIKSDLSALRDAVKSLKSPIFWQRRQATSSDDQVLTATAGSVAREGSYQIQVNRIAQAHAVATGTFSSVDEVVGTGTLTIRFGTWTYDTSGHPQSFTADAQAAAQTLTIDASNNTLSGIRDAINRAGIGVRASIVNDGSGYRLVLSSTETGEKRALEITVSDSDGNSTDNSGLSRLAFNAAALNLTQTRRAQDAELVVDGLTVTSTSNLVTGVIDGVTLNLKSASPGKTVNLAVGIDDKAITDALQKFVEAYNRLKGRVTELTAFSQEEGKENGILLGDGTLRAVDSQLRRTLGQVVQGLESAGVRSLADVGLSFDRLSGQLSLDAARFQGLLRSQPQAMQALFATQGTTTDAQVQYFGATSKTQAGAYAVEITRLATQGSYVGASVLPDFSSPLVIDAGNDEFTIEVDGVRSGTVRLTQGAYASGAELAQEIERQINADSLLKAAGRHVTVRYEADQNRLTFTSSTYGSASTVAFVSVDTNTASSLGLNVGVGTQGQDVAGKINGVEAIGRGQFLTGAEGNASEGLQLKITGGALGERGSVTLVRGVADRLDDLIQKLSEKSGFLGNKLEGLNKRLSRLAEQERRLNERMEKLEEFYLKRFNAMDQLVAKFKAISDALTQQLKALQPQTDNK
ncbi:MAG: flagellar filament capping protein FliD [Methylohalobius sp.]|nr:flagellar filament capping protein FliD [Methylohalobius sp.]